MNFEIKKIGLFGGSFDPVHIGHLLLARDAAEELGLERVILLPAFLSPHKLDSRPAAPAHRLAMLRAAVESDALFEVDDRELRKGGVSFTINTVREFREEFPDAELFYFIGEDNVEALPTWVEIEELKQLVRFVVMSRGQQANGAESFPRISRGVDISSTEIRNRVAAGRSIRYLVPEKVESLIKSLSLYAG